MNDTTLFGMPISAHPLIPPTAQKIKLHPDCPVGDQFRAEMDAWLLDMFGEEEVMYCLYDQLYAAPEVLALWRSRFDVFNFRGP